MRPLEFEKAWTKTLVWISGKSESIEVYFQTADDQRAGVYRSIGSVVAKRAPDGG